MCAPRLGESALLYPTPTRLTRRSGRRKYSIYSPRTIRTPARTSSSFDRRSFPTPTVRTVLSKLIICETLATESFGNPVARATRWTLPGASAHLRLLVSGTQITVAIRLRFKASDWITKTGLRKPGADPVGAGKSAHQISPCEITTLYCSGSDWRRQRRSVPRPRRSRRKPCSSLPLPHQENGAEDIP